MLNGNANDLSGLEDSDPVEAETARPTTSSLEDEEQVAMGDDEEERGENEAEVDKDADARDCLGTTPRRSMDQWSWSKVGKSTKRRREKKAVQFADGVRPGEGTSPSGGEGDMPSPPPPVPALPNDSVRDIVKRSRSRKSRKKKRLKPLKTKKKVKVRVERKIQNVSSQNSRYTGTVRIKFRIVYVAAWKKKNEKKEFEVFVVVSGRDECKNSLLRVLRTRIDACHYSRSQ